VSSRTTNSPIVVGGVLALAMLGTRSNHFGSSVELPDASLAVFFFAGLLLAGRLWFPALLVLAAAIDYVAITADGGGRYCVSPAYGFLIPAYGCVWVAGRFTRRDPREGAVARFAAAARLGVAAVLAFLISNLSFFAFSGYYAAMTLGDYVAATVRYAVPYVGYTLLYGAAGGIVVMLAEERLRPVRRASGG
jgi:hypothetical protein